MINFYSADDKIVCTGDTLFVLGCGRIFEGDAPMMWSGLEKLMALPDDTIVYCSHEYTLANAQFAVTVDPGNAALAERQAAFESLRENGLPTVPTRIDLEKATNPFLRASDPSIRAHLAMTDATDAEVFAEIRRSAIGYCHARWRQRRQYYQSTWIYQPSKIVTNARQKLFSDFSSCTWHACRFQMNHHCVTIGRLIKFFQIKVKPPAYPAEQQPANQQNAFNRQ